MTRWKFVIFLGLSTSVRVLEEVVLVVMEIGRLAQWGRRE